MTSLVLAIFKLAGRIVDRELELSRLREELAAERALSKRLGEALAEQAARSGELYNARRRIQA